MSLKSVKVSENDKYYSYKGKMYKVIDHIQSKDQASREWMVSVLYTDGKLLYTREVNEFYERFTNITNNILEIAKFELLNRIK